MAWNILCGVPPYQPAAYLRAGAEFLQPLSCLGGDGVHTGGVQGIPLTLTLLGERLEHLRVAVVPGD